MSKKYAEDYKKEYNQEFDATSAWTYDGLKILVDAIKKGGEDRAKIREAILAAQGIPGRPGHILFHSQRGRSERSERHPDREGKSQAPQDRKDKG